MSTLPPGWTLRDATSADAEALLSLYRAAYAPGQDPHRDRAGKPLLDSLHDVRGFLAERAVLVAEDSDGRLAGSAALRAIANIRRVAVHPDHKKKGVAGALVDAVVERARREKFDHAELDTQAEHPWLPSFYARHGFVERGVETMTDGSRWLVMRQRL